MRNTFFFQIQNCKKSSKVGPPRPKGSFGSMNKSLTKLNGNKLKLIASSIFPDSLSKSRY